MICSDFQCMECGLFIKNYVDFMTHVSKNHQRKYLVSCPYKGCSYKSGSRIASISHVQKVHLKYHGCDSKKLYYGEMSKDVKREQFDIFKKENIESCKVLLELVKYYLPVNMYGDFEECLKNYLPEFERFLSTNKSLKLSNKFTNIVEKKKSEKQSSGDTGIIKLESSTPNRDRLKNMENQMDLNETFIDSNGQLRRKRKEISGEEKTHKLQRIGSN
uniref:C2H2-type domain-containing protein n=1 Tax=Parastrongyloides trichosuri TaxID=131310 RepID=A0A0N4Z130_PARTI